MSYSEEECQRICELTHQYLHWLVYRVCKDHARVEMILTEYKAPYRKRGELSLSELYEHFCGHAGNKSRGGNAIKAIFGNSWQADKMAGWEKLRQALDHFNPHYVKKTFPTIYSLREKIVDVFQQNQFTGPVEGYIVSVFEIGHFLAQFPDGAAVYSYLDSRYEANPTMLIQYLLGLSGIHRRALSGLGEGLLRDALKELGYINYVKPDIHIKDISRLLDIIDSSAYDEQIAEAVAEVALKGRITPYQLDKFFYLIGSGEFYVLGHESVKDFYRKRDSITRKQEFSDFVKERIGLPGLQMGDRVALLVSYADTGLFRGQVGTIQTVGKDGLVNIMFKLQNQPVEQTLYPTEFVVLHG